MEGAITTKRRADASNSVSRSSGAFGPRAQPPNTIITIAAWRQYGDAEVFEKLLFSTLTPDASAAAGRGVLRPPPPGCTLSVSQSYGDDALQNPGSVHFAGRENLLDRATGVCRRPALIGRCAGSRRPRSLPPAGPAHDCACRWVAEYGNLALGRPFGSRAIGSRSTREGALSGFANAEQTEPETPAKPPVVR